MGTGVIYRGKIGRAMNSTTSLPKVEVKNEWSHTSVLPISLHGVAMGYLD